jgi:PAS domain S-box-containing protein
MYHPARMLPDALPAALLEESTEDLYENAPCGYFSALPDGTLVKVNQTFLTWTGYRREDLVSRKRLRDLLTAGGRIFYETHYAPLLRMQGWVREIAVDVVCADGRRLPVLLHSTLRIDPEGQPLLSRTTVFNATDRKEYERELLRERQRAEQADKAKATFISMLSHEIRNPLNAVMGIGNLLTMTELSAQQRELVGLLRAASENLMSLINDVLDFSRIEAGGATLEERSFDLRQLVHHLAATLRLKADEKGLALDVRLDERIPSTLLGDPVKIGQVITNLLGNALKFTSKGSVTLELEVREQDAEATEEGIAIAFRVADTGIGIPRDRLAYIFDDFTQASYDVGMKYGGSGLGLAISRRLVEMHGGRIAVESEPERGTTFSFVLRLKLPRRL